MRVFRNAKASALSISDTGWISPICLKAACINGRVKTVKFLIENGADIHANNDKPLYYACKYGYINIVELLIGHGANVHANFDAALKISKKNRKTQIIKLLLESGNRKRTKKDDHKKIVKRRPSKRKFEKRKNF